VYAQTEQLVLTITDSRGSALHEVMDALRDAGGRGMRAFDPDLIIGHFPLGADLSAAQAIAKIRVQRKPDVRPDQRSVSGARPYQLVRPPETAPRPEEQSIQAPLDLPPLCGVREPEMPPAGQVGVAAAEDEPRNHRQNALLMAGRILVNIVLPEAQSPRWTDAEVADVLAAAHRAFENFERDARRSHLDIIFRTHIRIRVAYDPTWYAPESDRYWIQRVMYGIGGSASGSSVDMTHRYNEQKRRAYQADWALMILVANSKNREDLLFRDSREVSWSTIGGPYMVMPYPAGGLLGVQFQSLMRHEIAHIFWALDETNHGRHVCEDKSGYLRYENNNRRVGIFPGISCDSLAIDCCMDMGYAMGGYTGPICHYTKGMIGVVDANDNDIPDALDAPPLVTFNSAPIETLFAPLNSIHVEAFARSRENRNPRLPLDYRLEVVAPLLELEVSITYAKPFVYTPDDVGSDGSNIKVDVPLSKMFSGWNDVQAVAKNIFLSESEPVGKSYLYVNLDFTSFELLHPKNEGVNIRWLVRGETFDANMEVFRRNARTQETIQVANGVQPSGPPDVGHTPYEFTDVDLEPGTQYEYLIRGTIIMLYRDEIVTVVRVSPPISTQAAVPRIATVSDPAPNPFNPSSEHIWLSVTLPQDSQSLLQTPVELAVFDVAGRRVTTIANGSFLGDVQSFSWDGTDNHGRDAPAGIYFFRLVAADEVTSRKVLLIR